MSGQGVYRLAMTAPVPVPRRRWYHRYAVLELSLIRPVDTIVSWHATRAGAAYKAGHLIATKSAVFTEDQGASYFVGNMLDFVPLPADNVRVTMAAKR